MNRSKPWDGSRPTRRTAISRSNGYLIVIRRRSRRCQGHGFAPWPTRFGTTTDSPHRSGWNEEGVLRRRHIFADTIEDIGKESDGWEAVDARSEGADAVLTYPSSPFDRERMVELIKSVGKRELMREARIAMRTIDAVSEIPTLSG